MFCEQDEDSDFQTLKVFEYTLPSTATFRNHIAMPTVYSRPLVDDTTDASNLLMPIGPSYMLVRMQIPN